MLADRRPTARPTRLTRVVLSSVEASYASIEISWGRVRGADAYEVRVQNAAGERVHDEETEETRATLTTGVVPGARYVLHVRACAGDSMSSWSSHEVVTPAAPVMPTIASADVLYPPTLPSSSSAPATSLSTSTATTAAMSMCPTSQLYGNLDGGGVAHADNQHYRFCTFHAGRLESAHAAELVLEGAVGDWQLTRNGMLAATLLTVALTSAPIRALQPARVTWYDANATVLPRLDRKPGHNGRRIGVCDFEHTGVRRITVGGKPTTADVYVRIGLPADGRRIGGVRVRAVGS